MAFCPHCGTRLGAQANTCEACGARIQAAPATADSRFKGTMMMSPTSPQPRGPGDARPQKGPAPPNATMLGGFAPEDLAKLSGQNPAGARAASPAPAAPGRPVQRASPAPASPGRPEQRAAPADRGQPAAFNATIVGGLSAPEHLRKAPPQAARPGGPQSFRPTGPGGGSQPGHAPSAHDATALGHAPTAMTSSAQAFGHAPTAMGGMDTGAANRGPSLPRSGEPIPGGQQQPPRPSPVHTPPYQEESTPRMLVGDPMASSSPQPFATEQDEAPRLRTPAQRSTRPFGGTSGLMWVAIGFVGMLAIAGIGVLAAKMLGLM